jgi:hypothetical protein
MKEFLTAWITCLALLQTFSPPAYAKDPDCAYQGGFPSSVAHTYLRNAGFFKPGEVNIGKSVTTRLASEKIGKNLYHQVHLVKFIRTSGKEFSVITVSDGSREECSLSDVVVYLISKQYGEYKRNP